MSANKNGIKSDLARMDAYVNTAEDYAEIPEMTDEFFERADHNRGGVLISRGRGRPAGSNKLQMNLRIDIDVIDAFKSQGEGRQTRMNEALRDYAKSHGILD
jgi:uncharacterized protein (DUF4415 family)